MQRRPLGKRVWLLLWVAIVLVVALFFFEWLGSEQPQKVVEIEVEPGTAPGNQGASGKD